MEMNIFTENDYHSISISDALANIAIAKDKPDKILSSELIQDQKNAACTLPTRYAIPTTQICDLISSIVATQLGIPIKLLLAKTRARADAARARQIAVYLAHTSFSVSYREAGTYFRRDRTTIAHACKLVEDQRDDRLFDKKLTEIEDLIRSLASLPSPQPTTRKTV